MPPSILVKLGPVKRVLRVPLVIRHFCLVNESEDVESSCDLGRVPPQSRLALENYRPVSFHPLAFVPNTGLCLILHVCLRSDWDVGLRKESEARHSVNRVKFVIPRVESEFARLLVH